MSDISPELLEAIQKEFDELVKSNRGIQLLYKKIRDGTATYIDADQFAQHLGQILARAITDNLAEDILPDGRLYWNIAKSVVEPLLKEGYRMMVGYVKPVQTALNAASDVKLAVITPKLNQSRVDGILNKLATAENFGDVRWMVSDPAYFQNYLNSVVDDFVRENADFQYESGYNPLIIRVMHGNGCDFCEGLAGVYEYTKGMDRTVFVRHRNCQCTIEYQVGQFSQDVHTKRLMDSSGSVLTKEQLQKMDASTLTSREARARQRALRTMELQEERAIKERLVRSLMVEEGVDHRTASIRLTRRSYGH